MDVTEQAGRYSSLRIRPPAPRPRARPLGTLATLLVLRRNPLETWTRAHFEYPILIGSTILGMGAVVSDPAAIRRIFVDNAGNYAKDDLQKRVLSPGLGDGLLTVEGAAWRVQRRILAPLFTPKMVAGFNPAIALAADRLVARWLKKQDGARLDIQEEMASVTLDVLGTTLFADGLGHAPRDFMAAITQYFETIGRLDPFDLLDMPEWLPRLNERRSRPALRFFAEAIETIIARRRRRLRLARRDPTQPAPRDLLGVLLEAHDPESGEGLSDAEVRANIITFIGAGHETTANALTWTLYLLSLSEEWTERVAAEAEAVVDRPIEDWADALPQTRAVLEEAMRLYPPVANMSREALGPDDLAGRRIRKGTLIFVAPYILHRHRRLWDDPDAFDPRRFLPGAREKIDRFAYLPFGAGPRVCIGAAFAQQEALIVLAKVMRHFRLTHDRRHVVKPVQHITLRPQGGMPMHLWRR